MVKNCKFTLWFIAFIFLHLFCTNTHALFFSENIAAFEDRDYKKAMKTYIENKEEAIKAFKEYLKSYPSSENVPKVQFMMAECLFYEALKEDKNTADKESTLLKAISEYHGVSKGSIAEDAKLRVGECYYNLGNYDKAIKSFKDISTSDYKYYLKAESLYNLILCYIATSNFNLAEDTAKELLRLYPAYENQDKIYFPLGLIYYQKKKPEDALKYLERSNTDDSLYYQGLIYAEMDKPLLAIVKFKKLIQEHKKSVYLINSQFLLGEMFYKAKDYSSAIKEYQNFRKSYPENKLAIFAIYKESLSLYYQKCYQEAINLGEFLVKKYPQDNLTILSTYLIGNCYYHLNKISLAIFTFDSLIKKYPEKNISMLAQFKLKWLRFHQERYLSITSVLDEVINIHPDHILKNYTYFLYGKCYQNMNNNQGAMHYFKQVLNKSCSPELAEAAIYSICEMLYTQKDYHQITGSCRFLINSYPFTKSIWRANTLLLIADSYYRLNLSDEAKEVYDMVLSNFPKSEASLYANDGLMWCYIQNEEYQKAAKAREEIAASIIEGKIKDKFLTKSEYERANCLFNQENYLEALDAYEEYIKNYPQEEKVPLALYNSGLCYYRMQYYTQAIETWKKLVQDYSRSKEAHDAAYKIADTYFRAQKYAESIAAYREIISKYPESKDIKEAFFRIGLGYFNDNKDKETIEAIQAFVFKFPEEPQVYDAFDIIEASIHRRETSGNISSEKKSLVKSKLSLISILEKFIKEFPNSKLVSEIQYRLAKKYYEIEDYNKSVKELQKVVMNFPDSSSLANTLYLLGDSYGHLNNFNEAVSAYERLIQNFPNDKLAALALFQQGTAYYNLNNFDKAITSYKRIIKDYPNSDYTSVSQFNCALCWKKLDKYEEAVGEYELFCELYPKDNMINEVLMELGTLYQKLKQYNKAILVYNKLQNDLKPDHPAKIEFSYYIADIYLKMEEKEKAIKEFKNIQAAKPPNDPYRLSALAKLGDIYEDKKMWKEAILVYKDIERNTTEKSWKEAALSRIGYLEKKAKEIN